METYEKKLLMALVEKYRKSKKDSGTNVITRRTRITPDKLYKAYRQNDGDLEKIEAVNQAVYRCHERGFLTFDQEGFSNEIRAVYLEDEKLEEIERYLEETYQYESRYSKKQRLEELITEYENGSPSAGYECGKLKQMLKKNRIPQNYSQMEDMLRALVFIENNKRELFLREVSMLLYGDSKYLEENVLHSLCRELREYLGRPCREDELEDEILEDYHIVRERQKLCLKGNITIRMTGRELDLGAFADGVEFFADELRQLEWIHIRTSHFMTVENRTSWLRLKISDTALFYLGGYSARSQRDFLKKVFRDNPKLTFWHFGDIDAGGLYIHEHLCRVTGIPFRLYRMSRKELENPHFKSCLLPLTQQDRIRLKSLMKQETYQELVIYMLEQNVKLEQEIVSFYETENGNMEEYFVY